MLIIWPIFTILLFKRFKLELDTGVILALIVPYLVLPAKTVIDLPLIPPLDKYSIPIFTIVVLLYNHPRANHFKPKNKVIWLFFLGFILSPFLTFLTNSSPISFGPKSIPGLGFMDCVSMIVENFTRYYLPFFLGAMFITSDGSNRTLVRIIAGSVLIYSIPMLWEVRMSPQLQKDIYGYALQWAQQMRQGGFRPSVFLGHGLLVAMLAAQGFICALILAKSRDKKLFRLNLMACSVYLLVVIILCKTLAALIYAVVFGAVIFFLKRKPIVLVALVVSFIVLSYPIMKPTLIPTDWLLEQAYDFDPERGQSLGFRFENEEDLLNRANLKPFLGWGGWGRAFDYNEQGLKTTTADGIWIIVFGAEGWLGYLLKFGLPFIAIFAVYRALNSERSTSPEKISFYTAGLCIVVAMNLIDSLPNSSLSTISFLVAGAIWGRATAAVRARRSTRYSYANNLAESAAE